MNPQTMLPQDEERHEEIQNSYEEPILLGAEDLENVAGGCLFNCSDGSCKKPY